MIKGKTISPAQNEVKTIMK